MKTIAEMLDTVRQALIITELDGRITHWNSHAERLYGWSRDEVIGRQIVEVLCPRSQVDLAEEIMESLRSGRSWGGPFIVRHRNGHEFEAFVIDAPLVDGGKLVGIIGVLMPVDGKEKIQLSDTLTPRECEVAKLTAEGKTSAEIGSILGIAARTVETHRANLYRKLGVRSRAELIFRSVQIGNVQ